VASLHQLGCVGGSGACFGARSGSTEVCRSEHYVEVGPHAEIREERRIVTALFADIVGSTRIAERLDPEDTAEVLGGAIALLVEQVDALGGTVKDLAGDGVLALFGAPTAHEDDAERAVLCGLRMTEVIADTAAAIAQRHGVEGFSVRGGIETGRAVVGPVGEGSRIEYGSPRGFLCAVGRFGSRDGSRPCQR
jgi:class 3 adenylate cyclase